jgi:hypothetical protein
MEFKIVAMAMLVLVGLAAIGPNLQAYLMGIVF